MLALAVLIIMSPHIQMANNVSSQGTASYYTNAECPGKTASGEQFDDRRLTCAMRTGEFGRYYLITGEKGWVIAKLNDRGPWVEGRTVDLSKAAMAQICDLEKGLCIVTVSPLGWRMTSEMSHRMIRGDVADKARCGEKGVVGR